MAADTPKKRIKVKHLIHDIVGRFSFPYIVREFFKKVYSFVFGRRITFTRLPSRASVLEDFFTIDDHQSLLLPLLSISDIIRLQSSSRCMRKLDKDHEEVNRRTKLWCNSVSLCLPETAHDGTDVVDDRTYPDGLGGRCGGWPRLLHARAVGPPLQPAFVSGPPFAVASGEDAALLWEIRCDGEWRWSGVQPLHRDRPSDTQCVDRDYNLFKAAPRWADALRDTELGNENVVWSGRPDDRRRWDFTLSLICDSGAETLLHSHSIVPQHLVSAIDANNCFIQTNDNFRLEGVADGALTFCHGANPDRELDDGLLDDICPEAYVAGVEEDGSESGIFQDFDFCVFSDERELGARMIHLTWGYSASNDLFSQMIINPPT